MSALNAASSWERRRLRDALTKLVDGSHSPPPKQETGVPMLSARNVDRGQILFDDYRLISEDDFAAEHARTRITPGDVLLTIVGTIGRTAVVPDGIQPFSLQRSVAVLSPKQDLLPKFLSYQLQSPAIQQHFEEHARGTAQKGVYLKTLGETPISFPLLAQQQEIVSEIEKQFSRLDEAVANLKRVKANLKRYRATVLKAAVEGRLVPTEAELARSEGRRYATGAQLLQRILDTRRSQWKGKAKYKEPTTPDTTDRLELPEGWVWATIAHLLCQPIINGLSIKGSDAPPGTAALKLNAMSDKGFDYEQIRYLPIATDKVLDILVRNGDFFVSRGNGSLDLVGRGTIAQSPKFKVIFPDTMMRLRLHSLAINTKWVATIWPSRWVRRQIEQRVKTTAGIYKIAQPQMESIVVPLPPLAEQHRIVAELDRRLSVLSELEVEVEASIKRAGALRQAVLADAFAG